MKGTHSSDHCARTNVAAVTRDALYDVSNDELQRYAAEVPELPGCNASGKTRVDAVFHAENAIAVWIETARLSGDPIPQPRGRMAFC